MGGIDEEDSSEILVADTNSESGSEASDFEDYFEEEEEEYQQQQNNNYSKPQQKSKHTGCNKWWQITNLGTASRKEHKHSTYCQSSKSCEKKCGSTHSSQLSVLMFFTEIFHLLVEQTSAYYQQNNTILTHKCTVYLTCSPFITTCS